MKTVLKHLGVMVIATFAGWICLNYQQTELAGVCFGVVGTYALKNGVPTK